MQAVGVASGNWREGTKAADVIDNGRVRLEGIRRDVVEESASKGSQERDGLTISHCRSVGAGEPLVVMSFQQGREVAEEARQVILDEFLAKLLEAQLALRGLAPSSGVSVTLREHTEKHGREERLAQVVDHPHRFLHLIETVFRIEGRGEFGANPAQHRPTLGAERAPVAHEQNGQLAIRERGLEFRPVGRRYTHVLEGNVRQCQG